MNYLDKILRDKDMDAINKLIKSSTSFSTYVATALYKRTLGQLRRPNKKF